MCACGSACVQWMTTTKRRLIPWRTSACLKNGDDVKHSQSCLASNSVPTSKASHRCLTRQLLFCCACADKEHESPVQISKYSRWHRGVTLWPRVPRNTSTRALTHLLQAVHLCTEHLFSIGAELKTSDLGLLSPAEHQHRSSGGHIWRASQLGASTNSEMTLK